MALCCVLLALLLVTPVRSQSPEAKKILDDMIQTLGGQAYLDVNDIHMAGRLFQFKHGELTGSDIFSDYIKFPLMERTEFGREKRREIRINNGDTGWMIIPKDKEPREQTPGEVQEFKASFKTGLDYILRFTLEEKQTTIQHIGTEIINFNRADLIEIRDPAKNRLVLFIDRLTKLPAKLQLRRSDEKITREESYANWHAFQGIMTPLNITRFTDGLKTMEIHNETCVYNSNLPDSLFTAAKK